MSEKRAVLFDVDGTLVDTTYLHAVCWAEALRQHNHLVPMATIHRAIGMGSDVLLDHLVGKDRERADDEALQAAHLALYKQYWGRLLPLPGAADLLRWCARNDLDVVLASSASDDELDALRSALAAEDAITAATSSSDAQTSKPAPDILHVALEKVGVEPHDAMLVGDAVWDTKAAIRAGMAFVGVECGGTSAAELIEAGAIETWRDPVELLGNVASSALAKFAQSK